MSIPIDTIDHAEKVDISFNTIKESALCCAAMSVADYDLPINKDISLESKRLGALNCHVFKYGLIEKRLALYEYKSTNPKAVRTGAIVYCNFDTFSPDLDKAYDSIIRNGFSSNVDMYVLYSDDLCMVMRRNFSKAYILPYSKMMVSQEFSNIRNVIVKALSPLGIPASLVSLTANDRQFKVSFPARRLTRYSMSREELLTTVKSNIAKEILYRETIDKPYDERNLGCLRVLRGVLRDLNLGLVSRYILQRLYVDCFISEEDETSEDVRFKREVLAKHGKCAPYQYRIKVNCGAEVMQMFKPVSERRAIRQIIKTRREDKAEKV